MPTWKHDRGVADRARTGTIVMSAALRSVGRGPMDRWSRRHPDGDAAPRHRVALDPGLTVISGASRRTIPQLPWPGRPPWAVLPRRPLPRRGRPCRCRPRCACSPSRCGRDLGGFALAFDDFVSSSSGTGRRGTRGLATALAFTLVSSSDARSGLTSRLIPCARLRAGLDSAGDPAVRPDGTRGARLNEAPGKPKGESDVITAKLVRVRRACGGPDVAPVSAPQHPGSAASRVGRRLRRSMPARRRRTQAGTPISAWRSTRLPSWEPGQPTRTICSSPKLPRPRKFDTVAVFALDRDIALTLAAPIAQWAEVLASAARSARRCCTGSSKWIRWSGCEVGPVQQRCARRTTRTSSTRP